MLGKLICLIFGHSYQYDSELDAGGKKVPLFICKRCPECYVVIKRDEKEILN